jgi:hypothetical protein
VARVSLGRLARSMLPAMPAGFRSRVPRRTARRCPGAQGLARWPRRGPDVMAGVGRPAPPARRRVLRCPGVAGGRRGIATPGGHGEQGFGRTRCGARASQSVLLTSTMTSRGRPRSSVFSRRSMRPRRPVVTVTGASGRALPWVMPLGYSAATSRPNALPMRRDRAQSAQPEGALPYTSLSWNPRHPGSAAMVNDEASGRTSRPPLLS